MAIDNDVLPAESSTASEQAAPQAEGAKDAAPPTETVATEDKFLEKFEQLESGEEPAEAATESAAKPEEAQKDDRANPPAKAKEADVLSQDQEAALNKKFDERPEWKKALSLVPKQQQPAMRNLMREVLQREQAVVEQVKQYEPVVQKFERFRKSVGDDAAVENTIVLTELFQQGNPKAREMLVTLLNDLDARTGSVLTSPDLKQRAADIDRKVNDGLMEATDAETAKKDLLELEKSRVGQRQTEAQKSQVQQQADQTVQQQRVSEVVSAANDWEKEQMASDPDYPSLKKMVELTVPSVREEWMAKKPRGYFLTAADTKKLLEETLTIVKAEAAKFAPRPQARTRLNGGGSSATSRREPANADEAFLQEFEKREQRRR